MDPFINLIGQESVKKKLKFYIDAFERTQVMPFLMFASPKGYGKTEFARRLGRSLKNKNGSPRPFLEINSSTIRNNATFFEQIFMNYIHGNEVTIFFDEAHNIPNDLAQVFLTVCNTDSDPIREFNHGESNFVFDFTKITFLFATTEPDKIFGPLKDRFEPIDFKPYQENELSQIVKSRADGIAISNEAMNEMVLAIRDNPRSAVRMAQKVSLYCEKEYKNTFNLRDWKSLSDMLDILPLGMTNNEWTYLKILSKRKKSSLQSMVATTGMSRGSLQKDVENYLVRLGLIEIGSKREITTSGLELVKNNKKH